MRILVTGSDGQVGWELARTLAPLGEVIAANRAMLDLGSDDCIRAAVRDLRPTLIVNAAAYTAVDKAESEPERALRINADALTTLAAEAKAIDAAIIHYSTDYVFDGTKSSPYIEEDATNPLNVYGRTKLGGEQALARAGIPYLVLRTSWVYGPRGKNFLLTILRLAAEKPELRIVADQIGAPTSAPAIARATAAIAQQWMSGGEPSAPSGIYHLASSGETSWAGFAEEILKLRAPAEKAALVIPIPTAEYPTPAARPKNSRLNCGKLEKVFGIKLPEWQDSLAAILHELGDAQTSETLVRH